MKDISDLYKLYIPFVSPGSYFGSHFIMGGERFESPQPGEYLFGDSEELNFLGNKPVPVSGVILYIKLGGNPQ